MRSQIFITHSQIDVYKDFYEVLGLLQKFFTKSHPTFPQTRTDETANSYGRNRKFVWTKLQTRMDETANSYGRNRKLVWT